ncbi:MAG: hypothetical protein ACLQGP_34850, partial [Isosphaeraceae bacterium]
PLDPHHQPDHVHRVQIEREFRVRLATEELATVRRVGDLIDLMEAKLAERSDGQVSETVPASPEPEPS